MKHYVLLLVATSTLLSCQGRRDLLTNYYEDENYFNPALPSPYDVYGSNETLGEQNAAWSNAQYQRVWEGDSSYAPPSTPGIWGGFSSRNSPPYYQGSNGYGFDNDAAFNNSGDYYSNYAAPQHSFNSFYSPWYWPTMGFQFLPTGLPWNWYSPVWNMSGAGNSYGYNPYGYYGYNPYGYNPYGYYGYSPYSWGWGNPNANTGGSAIPAGTTHPNTRRPSRYSGSRGNSSRNGRTAGTATVVTPTRSSQNWFTPTVLAPPASAPSNGGSTPSPSKRTGWWEALSEEASNLFNPTQVGTQPTRTAPAPRERNSWQSGSGSRGRTIERSNNHSSEPVFNSSRSNSISPSRNSASPGATPSRSTPSNSNSSSGRRR